MDARELAMTALRGLAVSVRVLAVIRVLGKRTVGNFTAFDLLVALMGRSRGRDDELRPALGLSRRAPGGNLPQHHGGLGGNPPSRRAARLHDSEAFDVRVRWPGRAGAADAPART